MSNKEIPSQANETPAIKLYDMDSQEWRKGNFNRGDSWRSTEVSECGVCGTQTNAWHMGGWPGMGPRIVCEGGLYSEHAVIENTQEQARALEKKIKTYTVEAAQDQISEETRAKAQALLSHLQTERQLLQIKIDRLRGLFSQKALHNVQGITGKVTPVVTWFAAKYVPRENRSIAEELGQKTE